MGLTIVCNQPEPLQMRIMLTFLAVSLLSLQSVAQFCEPPSFAVVTDDIDGTFLYWEGPFSGCDVLYYEAEVNNVPFTPGMGALHHVHRVVIK